MSAMEPDGIPDWMKQRCTGMHATITPPTRRWGAYRINLSDGLMDMVGAWWCYGRKRTEAKARRLISQWEKDQAASQKSWEVF